LEYITVIPSMKDESRDYPFTNEELLASPYEITRILPSGCVLLRMTKETNFNVFDQHYADKIEECYKYFKKLEEDKGLI
jgi:hypothetical protein